MSKAEVILVTGSWNNTKEEFKYLACIGSESDEINDDVTFFYFDSRETVIGDHGDFTITSFE